MFALHAHLEFVTKYRHAVLTAAHLARMEAIRRTVCADFGCELVECNGEAEHVHLLVHFPPTVALSRPVNALKGVSSRRLRQAFPELARHYWPARRLRSGSYFAGSSARIPRTCSAPTSSSNADRATRFHLQPEGRSPLAEVR